MCTILLEVIIIKTAFKKLHLIIKNKYSIFFRITKIRGNCKFKIYYPKVVKKGKVVKI